MAWLCVDKDGSEKIFNCEPNRGQNQPDIDKSVACEGIDDDIWYSTCYGVDEHGYLLFDADLDCTTGVELPRGTIESLIGRKLTWEDEPVRYEKMNDVTNGDLVAKCVSPGFIRIRFKDRIPSLGLDAIDSNVVILSIDDFSEIRTYTAMVDYNRPEWDAQQTVMCLRDGRQFMIEGDVAEYILKAINEAKK